MQEQTTVLVADDEIDMRILVRVVLESAGRGLQVVGEAVDGDEALAAFARLNPPPVPDVVILDNRMPGLSGIEVAERIRDRFPDQRIILFSAFLDDEIRRRAAEIGIDACVSKPDIDQLPDLVVSLTAG
jgi:CheY-like chemotaxis protein